MIGDEELLFYPNHIDILFTLLDGCNKHDTTVEDKLMLLRFLTSLNFKWRGIHYLQVLDMCTQTPNLFVLIGKE